jgi:tRNA uridine 5-carboxymethylaminomethyl modification enzyme
LRIDNADRRLTAYGRRVGLIKDDAWQDYLAKQQRMQALKELLENTKITTAMLEKFAEPPSTRAAKAGAPARDDGGTGNGEPETGNGFVGASLAQLLKRPEFDIERLAPVLRELVPWFFEARAPLASSVADRSPAAPFGCVLLPAFQPARATVAHAISSAMRNELKSVETEIKYAGYLGQQRKAIERLKKAEQRAIPDRFEYASVSGLSREMKEKLQKVRPRTIGQASRIPGVTPAAVSLVNVYIEIQARKRTASTEYQVPSSE